MTAHNPTPATLRAQAQPDPTPALAARCLETLEMQRRALADVRAGEGNEAMEREWPLARKECRS
jgi:hypothetical protein